ncbi:epimerase [Sporosarcina sp. NCCP-2716]|uniref:SDR family NAD(P)-dependent oxidoreductase n=1 Tax=Sporosarcina sp. NCCP-2716 TaxID=2943679 RepID=UPI002041F1DE|nr:SDR family NAD(P)-dependent oxidoreductase [Sporosarcina sp. NCCP-2716]GKV70084.1 epimerase [Sporosarcina sp. NCCP-2716]
MPVSSAEQPMPSYSLLERLLFPSVRFRPERLTEELRGKTVLITGASSGIGEQVAYLLRDIPVHLILVARRTDRLLDVQRALATGAATVTVVTADLRAPDDLDRLIDVIHALPAGLDVFVSNAGLSIHRTLAASLDRFHDFERTMAINYFAPVRLLLAVLPLLRQNQGQVVNVSTINARLLPMPDWSAYQASKTAFDSWLRSSSIELRQSGVSVTTFYLPLVRTEMIRPTTAYDRMPAMTPVHVAKMIARSMYSKQKAWRPWWLPPGELASVLFRRPIEEVLLWRRGRRSRDADR